MIEGKKKEFLLIFIFYLVIRYTYEDEVKVDPSMENYEENLKTYFVEHHHSLEKARLVLEGSGFFDVQDSDKKWIRIHVFPGDLIILPAGKIEYLLVIFIFIFIKEFIIDLLLINRIIFVLDVFLLVNLIGRQWIDLMVIHIHLIKLVLIQIRVLLMLLYRENESSFFINFTVFVSFFNISQKV